MNKSLIRAAAKVEAVHSRHFDAVRRADPLELETADVAMAGGMSFIGAEYCILGIRASKIRKANERFLYLARTIGLQELKDGDEQTLPTHIAGHVHPLNPLVEFSNGLIQTLVTAAGMVRESPGDWPAVSVPPPASNQPAHLKWRPLQTS